MQSHRKLFSLMLFIPLLMLGYSVAADDATPSGTVVIDETQVAFIAGGDLGGGTLLFGDESYSFKTGGLKLGGIGIHKIHLVGDVYHLNDVKDFPGVYFVAEAGVTVGKGKGGLSMKNDKGVVLKMRSSQEGIALNLGVEGFKITMK